MSLKETLYEMLILATGTNEKNVLERRRKIEDLMGKKGEKKKIKKKFDEIEYKVYEMKVGTELYSADISSMAGLVPDTLEKIKIAEEYAPLIALDISKRTKDIEETAYTQGYKKQIEYAGESILEGNTEKAKEHLELAQMYASKIGIDLSENKRKKQIDVMLNALENLELQ